MESAFVVWLLTGYPVKTLLSDHGLGSVVAAAGLAISWCLLAGSLLHPVAPVRLIAPSRMSPAVLFLWAAFLVLGLTSSLVNSGSSAAYQLALIVATCSAGMIGLSNHFRPERFINTAAFISWPFVALWWASRTLGDALIGFSAWRNPAYGVVALAALAGTLRVPFRPGHLVGTIVVLASLFLNSHRSTLLGGIAMVGAFAVLSLAAAGKKKMVVAALGVALLASAGLAGWVAPVANLFGDKVLLLADPHRGLGSGFSARAQIWAESARLIGEKPFLGWGARANETILSSLSLSSSVHNGVLLVLFDYGVLGGSIAVALLLIPLAKVVWLAGSVEGARYRCAASFVCGYVVMGLGERYWFNVGNPSSVLLLILAMGFGLRVMRTEGESPLRRRRLPRLARLLR